MSEPTGPPIVFYPSPTKGFSTEYTRKLKNKCRLKHSQYDKILKLTLPKSIKAKIKRTGQKYVSTNTLELFQDSDNEVTESKAPQVEISTIRPSNDPQTVGEAVISENTSEGDTNATRKPSVADSGDSIEYHDSVERLNDTPYDDTTQRLIDVLENSEETIINTSEESTITSQMDTSTGKEPGENTPDKFEFYYQTDPNSLLGSTITLPLPTNVMANLLNFKTNQLEELPKIPAIHLAMGSAENAPKSGELSNRSEGKVTAPPVLSNPTFTEARSRTTTRVDPRLTTRINSNPRIKIQVQNSDIPFSVASNIHEFDPNNVTSEEEPTKKNYDEFFDHLPHSPNSLFERRNERDRARHERENRMDVDQPPANKTNEEPFLTPKKFSRNFENLIKEKTRKTLTTNNKFQPLTDDSDSDIDDEIGKIVKKRKKGANFKPLDIENLPTVSKDTRQTLPNTTTAKSTHKNRNMMPPIVIDGRTSNQRNLIQDLKGIVKGEFSVKHTNYTTIIFVETKDDYERVLANIKTEKMPYHTYTPRDDKTHAFVLRGLAQGTKIVDIEQNLEEEHEITTKAIYKMKTKERPLYLVITDPVITLDYLNKNAKRVLYTRVSWELRKSTKMIIQCHNCQQWGHATANCGRQPRCLKCAGDHHTSTCSKTPDTPATCANCGGDHPANYSKCENYTTKLERMLERRPEQNTNQKFVPAPQPAINQWEARRRNRNIQDDFPALPSRNSMEYTEPLRIPPRRPEIPRNTTPNVGMDDFTALNNEFQTLNSIINIGELTRAVRALNAKLIKCTTGREIIETYNAFMTDVDINFKLMN